MKSLMTILGAIIVLGQAGRLIDFLIGTGKQRAVKDWLLRKWVYFDDLNLSNFSEKEATLYIEISDKLFGKQFLSLKRFLNCSYSILSVLIVNLFILVISSLLHAPFFHWPRTFTWSLSYPDLICVTISILLLATSVSVSRWTSKIVADISKGRKYGLTPHILLTLLHLALIVFWRPVIDTVVSITYQSARNDVNIGADDIWFIFLMIGNSIEMSTHQLMWFFDHGHYLKLLSPSSFKTIDLEGMNWISDERIHYAFFSIPLYITYSANLARVIISTIFLISFIFRKWISKAASLVWRRIIEEDKGPFTLILGGFGGLAAALAEIFKSI